MRINECKTVYICPAHNAKYIARKNHMEALLSHLRFQKIEHQKSGTDKYPKCLNDAYTSIFSKHLDDSPLLLLEDDVEVLNSNLTIDVPPDADAIQVGISKCGGHPTENVDLGHSTWTPQNDQLVRIQNMLSTHAILYLSKRYKEAVMQTLSRSGSEHSDVHISRIQKNQNVQALMKPIFQQSDKFGNHPIVKRMTQFLIQDNYVGIRLQGGLGKQLFLAMAGASQAIQNNVQLVNRGEEFCLGQILDASQFSKVSWKPQQEKVPFAYSATPIVKDILLEGSFQNPKQFPNVKPCLEYLKISVPKSVNAGTAIHITVDNVKANDVQRPMPKEQFLDAVKDRPKPYTVVTNQPNDALVQDISKDLQATLRSEDPVSDFWFLVSHDNLVVDSSTYGYWAAMICRFRNGKAIIQVPSHLQSLF